MSDETYSSSPSDVLTFSTDTVQFDIVMTGQGANTRTMEIYNPNSKKALRISKVWLAKGASSYYRVNVDGSFLSSGTDGDFEVRSKDSIRVFVELTPPVTSSDAPEKVDDQLMIQLESGVIQKVQLIAYGQNVTRLKAPIFTTDTTLSSARPFQILDSLVVAPGVTLTLSPGTKLYFHPSCKMVVRGTLIANGNVGNPIMMRGDRLGNMFSNQPYDRIPGQWGGIEFKGSSYGNKLNFCDIHSGSFGIVCDSGSVDKEKLRLENSIVHNVSGNALLLRNCQTFIGNSQISNAGTNCVALYGGAHQFVQCTIADFYSFDVRKGVALMFTNYDGTIKLPLLQADFLNCVITGYSNDEFLGSAMKDVKDLSFNYLFQNCLLDTPKYEDEKVVNCQWDVETNDVFREKNFYPRFDLTKLVFTFGLDSLSKAVGNADLTIARSYYPQDRLGIDRVSLQKPDIGCYQRMKP